ncbi:MAG: glutamate--tRNA ligase [bacterium]
MTISPSQQIRTRFAPSPTGKLHVGGLRTALFSWLYARKHKGRFILRIEDTDQARFVPGSVEQITEALRWTGLTYDEGPDIGGPYGPYIQSERLASYRDHADMLVKNEKAYYCFCTPERLQTLRESQAAKKLPPQYDRHCRGLKPEEVAQLVKQKTPYVIRLKLPEQGSVVVEDLIRGNVTFAYETLDDSVLLKSDGYPTYHLAVVVDDHLMEITHVLRAEEWLPSTPKHLFLYEAFDWVPPTFAHLPIILSPSGGKMSKRAGATAVLEYRSLGYLPEALINFLALLGWNPKTDRERFTLEELAEVFTLEGVQKSGAVFDQQKLDHLNGQYLRSLSPAALLARSGDFGRPFHDHFGDRAEAAVTLVQDRCVTFGDLKKHGAFLLAYPAYDTLLLIPKKGSAASTVTILEHLVKCLTNIEEDDFISGNLKEKILQYVHERRWTNAESLWPLRVAVSGQHDSPGVFDILSVLGKQESILRVTKATHALAGLAKKEKT